MAAGSSREIDRFIRLSKALKQAGQTDMRKALHKGMRDAVAKHKPEAEQALADILPSGLKKRAKVRQAIKVRTGTDPGVSVVVPYAKRLKTGLGASNARMLNNHGRIRHPDLADVDKPREEWRWVNQDIDGSVGWFDNAWTEASPEVRRELEREVEAVLRQIVRKVR